MDDVPSPPVPADCDLTGCCWMPLYGHRLFGSDFNSTCSDAEWRAGVTLWWRAWNQIPAASLPDDDAALARLADLGRDVKTWRKIRAKALHGFIRCSDGRLYHMALAQFAVEAWDRRIKERARKAKWRENRWGDKDVPETGTERGQERDEHVTGDGLSPLTGKDRTGQDLSREALSCLTTESDINTQKIPRARANGQHRPRKSIDSGSKSEITPLADTPHSVEAVTRSLTAGQVDFAIPDNRRAYADQRVAELIGWPAVMAARDGDAAAAAQCLAAARSLGITWDVPAAPGSLHDRLKAEALAKLDREAH